MHSSGFDELHMVQQQGRAARPEGFELLLSEAPAADAPFAENASAKANTDANKIEDSFILCSLHSGMARRYRFGE